VAKPKKKGKKVIAQPPRNKKGQFRKLTRKEVFKRRRGPTPRRRSNVPLEVSARLRSKEPPSSKPRSRAHAPKEVVKRRRTKPVSLPARRRLTAPLEQKKAKVPRKAAKVPLKKATLAAKVPKKKAPRKKATLAAKVLRKKATLAAKIPPKAAKAPKKKEPKTRLVITLNGAKLSRKHGIHERMTFVEIVSYTAVPFHLAVVRVNGVQHFQDRRIGLQNGDDVRVRRLVKCKKATELRSKAPEEPSELPKKVTEFVRVPDVTQPLEWVNAFPDEWLHQDGSVAVEQSFVRCRPDAEKIRADLEVQAALYGVNSAEFRRLAELVAEHCQRPLREVYTLFLSP